MTTEKTMAQQLAEAGYFIGALESAGLTPTMRRFLRNDLSARMQLVEFVKQLMPALKPAEPVFRITIAELDYPHFIRVLVTELDRWEQEELVPFIEWTKDNPDQVVLAFENLTARNGAITMKCHSLNGRESVTRASVAREFGLSAVMIKSIAEKGMQTVAYALFSAWGQATLAPGKPLLVDLKLPLRLLLALQKVGIYTPAELSARSDDDLLNIPGIGEGMLRVIRLQLERYKNKQIT